MLRGTPYDVMLLSQRYITFPRNRVSTTTIGSKDTNSANSNYHIDTYLELLSQHSLQYSIPESIFPTYNKMPVGQQESGVTSGVKFVTSTVGNTVGGVTNTAGGVVGALGRGVGETLEGATGSAGRPVARGIADATTSVEDGAGKIAGGVKRAGEGK